MADNQAKLINTVMRNVNYEEEITRVPAPMEVKRPVIVPELLDADSIILGRLHTNWSADVGLNMEKLMDGRMLIQGTSGAGKSWTMRRFLEQSAGRIQQIIIDPEGEFQSLAEELGYLYIEGHKLNGTALAELARRVREKRISVVIDLSDCRREQQMMSVAAICHTLVECPVEMWHPALVAIDEAHLFAPLGIQGQESAAVRKASVAAVVDLMSRGRKRGLAGVLATQRLARISKSVVSEIHNFLIGRNTLDLDIKRSAEMIGWETRKAYDRLPLLNPGEFIASGPAFSLSPSHVMIGDVKSRHIGAAPKLQAIIKIEKTEAHSLLAVDELVQMSELQHNESNLTPQFKAVRSFIREPHFLLAARIFDSLRGLMPDGTTIASLTKHLKVERDVVIEAIALLESFAAIDIENETVRIAPKFFFKV